MANEETIRNLVREVVRQALVESHPPGQSPPSYFAPWTGVEYEAHPSRQQFHIDEAIVTIGELLEFAEAGACSIEKSKPCDHCGICKSLGF